MKKRILLVCNALLMLMMLTSCSKPAVTQADKPPKDTVQADEPPKDTVQAEPEPVANNLSLDEAQDLLFNFCELKDITYTPDIDKEERIFYYGFLIDYFDNVVGYSGATHCYALVNTSTGMISFEEAGYSGAGNSTLYSNIPDSMFPVPMRNGMVIPYDKFSPPDYVSGVTYSYFDKSVMETYQAQLIDAGFIDLGTVESVESLWQYTQENGGPTFTIEMYSEGEMFSMNMYINN